MHYISVKQEHGVPSPGQLFEAGSHDIADEVVKRRKIVDVIDLCDSDNESTEGNPPGSSSADTPDSNPNDNETNVVTSNATQPDISAIQSRPGPGTRLLATSQARTSSKCKIVTGTIIPKPAQAYSPPATAPATDIPPVTQSYWRKRLDPPDQSESTATSTHDTTDPSTSATAPATTSTPGSAKPKVKKRIPQPRYDHPHKYRGPELTVLSLRAIWDHLDRAWNQASCTVQTIKRLQSWWNPTVITSTHGLNKHQVYLLLFAQSKWWQALEEQWTKFDALPTKDRKVIMKMREVRLRKESYAIKYEAALVNEGIIKSYDTVYMLGSGVKKEKVDQEDDKEKGLGEKRKRSGHGGAEDQKEDEGAKTKRVRIGNGETADKGAVGSNKGGEEKENSDDGLSSDSDEEED